MLSVQGNMVVTRLVSRGVVSQCVRDHSVSTMARCPRLDCDVVKSEELELERFENGATMQGCL